MTPGRHHVLLSLPSNSIQLPSSQQGKAISFTLDYVLRETLYEDPFLLIFSDLERLLGLHILQKVIDSLIVNLNKWAVDGIFPLYLLSLIEYISYCPGYDAFLLPICYHTMLLYQFRDRISSFHFLVKDDTFLPREAKHGIGLPWSSLTIGKHSWVVALKYSWNAI
jgi:hypothetical protein